MKINKTVQTPNGPVTFSGEMSQEEFDFVVEAGLNYLLAKGQIPYQVVDEEDLASIVPGTETHQ